MEKYYQKLCTQSIHKSLHTTDKEEQIMRLIKRKSSMISINDDHHEDNLFSIFISCIKKTCRTLRENQVIFIFLNQIFLLT